MNTDIRFGEGDNHVLVIHTSVYAGNIERELAGYAIGAWDEDRFHGGAQAALYEEDEDEDPRLTTMREKVGAQYHVEYDDVSNTIWPTPARVNNGMGGHFDEATYKGEHRYPAFESVAIFLDEALTDEELEIVKARAIDFGDGHTDHMGKPSPFIVKGVEQFTVSVETKKKVTRK